MQRAHAAPLHQRWPAARSPGSRRAARTVAGGGGRIVRGHWTLLSKLMAALRTERDVRLAVLFGSTATGEDTPVSDVDLLIVHRRSGWRSQVDLRMRLRHALGTPVDVVMLEQAEAQPSLLADVLREGRVLIDRDDLWSALRERRDQILAAGAREDEQIMTRARADARGRQRTIGQGITGIEYSRRRVQGPAPDRRHSPGDTRRARAAARGDGRASERTLRRSSFSPPRSRPMCTSATRRRSSSASTRCCSTGCTSLRRAGLRRGPAPRYGGQVPRPSLGATRRARRHLA